MDFTKTKTKDVADPNQNEDDSYVKEMKSRLLIKKHKGTLGEENLGNFYIEDEQDTDRQIRFRIEYSVNFWVNKQSYQNQSALLLAAVLSRSIYPFSVRFVKNRLKLQGFLNIHMVQLQLYFQAILPFIFISNGLVLGVYEGLWAKYWFDKEVEFKKKQYTRL
ncbi:unnamed protein product (macronuclear) [Paramecium tetraurelia]|uniref:Uncharacterized protein n=1 Tax=Paramecium tetraurelia TaxID=5888 RepID=A0D7A7_PARTE|nr:uncharacterized protein GSPATT00001966001 [Paramecium tetraurelia]CAK78924.1 unnamed protein product [Paramecium tetraurelia]|eukprot:XP_001446321.1 hypothetical protein (macronuclear) [Paramecium tetraurelia strain d4-2]